MPVTHFYMNIVLCILFWGRRHHILYLWPCMYIKVFLCRCVHIPNTQTTMYFSNMISPEIWTSNSFLFCYNKLLLLPFIQHVYKVYINRQADSTIIDIWMGIMSVQRYLLHFIATISADLTPRTIPTNEELTDFL